MLIKPGKASYSKDMSKSNLPISFHIFLTTEKNDQINFTFSLLVLLLYKIAFFFFVQLFVSKKPSLTLFFHVTRKKRPRINSIFIMNTTIYGTI